jgi:hypothetical protein
LLDLLVEIVMRHTARLAAPLAALAALACALAVPARGVDRGWMTEAAMRAAFIGKTLDGHYVDGVEWTETYDAGGRLDYKESTRAGGGYWFFRGRVFCTFYDPGQGLNGGCFTAVQASANCFEFYVADLRRQDDDEKDAGPGPIGQWVARAWRRSEPTTCEARPTV